MAIPLRINPNRGGTAEGLNMFKVSAVPPRRSAVLTVFRGATAINDGATAEPRRSGRSHCGLCRSSTAVAPRLRCDGASTAEARRNMFKVAAVPPRMSAVLTVFRGATTINDETTAEPRRSWRCHCGSCRTSTAVAPRLRYDGGISKTSCSIVSNALDKSSITSKTMLFRSSVASISFLIRSSAVSVEWPERYADCILSRNVFPST